MTTDMDCTRVDLYTRTLPPPQAINTSIACNQNTTMVFEELGDTVLAIVDFQLTRRSMASLQNYPSLLHGTGQVVH